MEMDSYRVGTLLELVRECAIGFAEVTTTAAPAPSPVAPSPLRVRRGARPRPSALDHIHTRTHAKRTARKRTVRTTAHTTYNAL
eukprot:7041053-Prymnesium_polylepis.1